MHVRCILHLVYISFRLLLGFIQLCIGKYSCIGMCCACAHAPGVAVQGVFNGQGRWEGHGHSYEGSFKDGHFDGAGLFQWSTGESLVAEWDTDCPQSGMLSESGSAMRRRVAFDGTTPLFNGANVVSLSQLKIITPGDAAVLN